MIEGTEDDAFKVERATPTPQPTIAPEDRDFRGMKWGMSLSDVTASDGEGYTTVAEGVIRYNDLFVGGYPVSSEYHFENGKLVTCMYYTNHVNSDTSIYLVDYEEMIKRYTNKYGEPQYSEEKWGDEKAKELGKAKALELGAMMFRTGWEVANTKINLVLFKDTDSKIKIGIRYMTIDVEAEGYVAPEGDISI